MSDRAQHNRQFISDLFSGEFRGHGIIMDAESVDVDFDEWDVSISEEPVEYFVEYFVKTYEKRLARHRLLDDDSVPFVSIATGTECFAAAFGCPVHIYDDSNPCALPLICSADQALQIQSPGLSARPMERILEAAEILVERLGREVPIGVPDMQSPFDIAALIWRKEDMFIAMCDQGDAVKHLVNECYKLQIEFLDQFMRIVPECNLCHCPIMWAPEETGVWVSEDEAGSLSADMFEEFSLPSLTMLSKRYGGLSLHCCAAADHQYANFKKIPNLKGLNRVFQAPGPKPAIEAFAGEAVLITAWFDEDFVNQMLDVALPKSRFMFTMPYLPDEQAERQLERLMKRCGRA